MMLLPYHSLAFVTLLYLSNVFTRPVPGIETSGPKVLAETKEIAGKPPLSNTLHNGSPTRAGHEMISDRESMERTTDLRGTHNAPIKKSTTSEKEELTQEQKDYIYGTSWGPGGKAVSYLWKHIKAVFRWLATPIRYAQKRYPANKSSNELNRKEEEALRKHVLVQQPAPGVERDGNRLNHLGSPQHFHDAAPHFDEAPSNPTSPHSTPDRNPVPQTVNKKDNGKRDE